jgi:hypothetical protein
MNEVGDAKFTQMSVFQTRALDRPFNRFILMDCLKSVCLYKFDIAHFIRHEISAILDPSSRLIRRFGFPLGKECIEADHNK